MVNDAFGLGKASESSELMTRELRKLILPFLKPAATEVGGLFGDLARLARERIIKVLTSANSKLAQAGLKPQPIQTKTFVPMLQACALEDDEDMIERWANLLASAAIDKSVSQAFVQTLSLISPEEARLLDALTKAQKPVPPKLTKPSVNVKDFRLSTSLPPLVFTKTIVTLFHLGLVQMVFPDQLVGGFPHHPPINDGSLIGTTIFCDEFLAACTRPPVKQ
jgi:hypothetical protein